MLAVHNLSLTKAARHILTNISFEIHNEIVTVLGPSGSGKTSLLRCIAGLEAYMGSVHADQTAIGFMEQDNTLFPHCTAYNNIAYPLKLRHIMRQSIDQKIMRLARELQIESVLKHYPHQLSGGEQRRVMLARTLIYEPSLLLFDEPFAGVDALLRVALVKQLKTVLEDRFIPTLYVTHDLAEADTISTHRIILRDGQIVPGTDPWVQTFMQQRF